MSDNKYVLAMYDVRGKQEFIFRTNKLQEIVGASWIIRDVFKDYLSKAAEDTGSNGKGIFGLHDRTQKNTKPEDFNREAFETRICDGYVGELVYDGGGNLLAIFKDEQTFNEVTYKFSKTVLEKIGSLLIQSTCVEIKNFDDYENDYKMLYKKHRINEAQRNGIAPWACLPIVQVDRKTTMPLVEYHFPKDTPPGIRKTIESKGVRGKLSKESAAKLLKFHSEMDRIKTGEVEELTETERDFYKNNVELLDDLVLEKGKDSQLAVIYIDGNGLGARFQNATNGLRTYEDSIKKFRQESETVQNIFVKEGIEKAFDFSKEKADANELDKLRLVVSAGDEVNFIVTAKKAFGCAQRYLKHLESIEGEDNSACAGIAVFHSHAPYADAYRIAEDACESGKQKMKELEIKCA